MQNQADFGPTNLSANDTAMFVAEFLDEENSLTVPSGATLSVTYLNINNAVQTDDVAMSLSNRFYAATWSSTSAALGLAVWTVTSIGESSAAQLGLLRITD